MTPTPRHARQPSSVMTRMGKLYTLTFTGAMTLSSYMDDAIRAKVETWADTIPALA